MGKQSERSAAGGGRRAGTPIQIRPATQKDLDALVALNRAAYPELRPEVLWSRAQLESHLRLFPEGQLVAVRDGRVVGGAASLVVNLGADPYREHTWAGITDGGMFYNHDPYGDTLYGADVYVHPEHRRQGVGRALYQARRELCQRLNLRRIVLGGRLHEYAACPEELTVEEYVRQVEAGDRLDPVLTFQLAMGFSFKRVLDRYLPDPRSRDFGTLLEWLNPAHKARPRKSRAVRVSCVQYRMRKLTGFDGFARQIRYFVNVAAGYDADFVLFPELLTAQLMSFLRTKTPGQAILRLTGYTARLDELFQGLAQEHQIAIVGGTHPIRMGPRIENVASLYLPDGTIHRQPKLHITPNERRSWGIEGGSTLKVFETPKAKVGILICYDVEFPEAARYLADQGAEVIFVPFCTDDRQGYLRVRYCAQARAVENQVYLALAGTVGNLPDAENMDIQYAQSAVLSPSDFPFARDGIMVEASVNTETVITTDLDFEALEEAINSGSVRQRRDRRPDLFQFTTQLGD